jgi:hypothetical protein
MAPKYPSPHDATTQVAMVRPRNVLPMRRVTMVMIHQLTSYIRADVIKFSLTNNSFPRNDFFRSS